MGMNPLETPETVNAERAPDSLLSCRLCPRLVAHREAVAQKKRKAYQQDTYWGRPVPGFGDPAARVLILGLAPGAHGSNRTGRQFTGDASGRFLWAALHRAGLASSGVSHHRGDGLKVSDLWVTAAVRCVPPGNKPTGEEQRLCRNWLDADLAHLPNLRVVLALGAFAHDAYLGWLQASGRKVVKKNAPFAHGAHHDLSGVQPGHHLVDSYHVSFQNTNTGRLTGTMFDAVLRQVQDLADA
jgi:uracil-DNA glycosylase family 4